MSIILTSVLPRLKLVPFLKALIASAVIFRMIKGKERNISKVVQSTTIWFALLNPPKRGYKRATCRNHSSSLSSEDSALVGRGSICSIPSLSRANSPSSVKATLFSFIEEVM